VLAELASTPVGAMRAAAAAAYIGVGRSTFYQLLRQDAQLAGSSFGIGAARMWRKEDLDAWMQAQVGPKQVDLTSGTTMKIAPSAMGVLRVDKTPPKPKR
jgi:predicted DNA-binding transcriptional regulator AlpA